MIGAPAPVGSESATAFGRLLLASEGRVIPEAAIDRASELVRPGGTVFVLSIARVHGVAFGLPNPGLMPTRGEWQEQRDIVARAVKRVRRRGLGAEGHVIGTRKAAKRICEEAAAKDCEAIVMAADADRNRVVADLLWTQEPQRVRRRAAVPVFLVPDRTMPSRSRANR